MSSYFHHHVNHSLTGIGGQPIIITRNINKDPLKVSEKSSQQNQPCLDISSTMKIILNEELTYVHPLINSLFSENIDENILPAARLKSFAGLWKKVTQDPEILSIVKRYQIPLLETPKQDCLLPQMSKNQINKKQGEIISNEVQEMSRKGTVRPGQHVQGEFLSSLFLVP